MSVREHYSNIVGYSHGDPCRKKGWSVMHKISWKEIVILQGIVIIYTMSTVCAKLASGEDMFSWPFIGFCVLEVFLLGVYAICWQQMIKRIDLSIAYLNRSMAVCWSMLWAFLIFHEEITWKNLVGIAVILTGIVIINTEKAKEGGDNA